ncbi:LacI family DNA-binding transcriptional regulator [Anaerobiospirillum thomasii]|uniref:Gluconate utilization system GNT-I transcriptional repressor n=1 Tax=Anaerobiospirillum thomasii TaxID=179995 RepID=A0A2X0V9U6_9GAMM|nr:LacI family DNA-binding transcriptional regulator [Anaerobiospirillum thomasii]SPT70543.1 Gluconate utilization system GNT-I transcriptional repressor [Anaerobiospirillum thomasii]
MSSRATLQDIADLVGVTKMTVSRYLNNRDSVAKETADKIQKAIEKLGYIPNRVPSMMSKSRSYAVGLLIPSFSNLVFPDVIDGVQEIALANNYNVLIAHTGYSNTDEESQIASLLSYKVDGLILTESAHTRQSLKMLSNAAIPVVELMEYRERPVDMCVGLDHETIAYNITKALIESGRKHIAYFGVRLDRRTMLRAQGYERALSEYGLESYTCYNKSRSNFTMGGDLMRKAVAEIKDLDAIICTNDDVAVGALIAAMDLKLSIPDDIAVVGYNGLNIGQATIPKLCSVDTPRHEMGRVAMQLILDRLNNKVSSKVRIMLECSITQGMSLTEQEYNTMQRLLIASVDVNNTQR